MTTTTPHASPPAARPTSSWGVVEVVASLVALVAIGMLFHNWLDAGSLWSSYGQPDDGVTSAGVRRWRAWSLVAGVAATLALLIAITRGRGFRGAVRWHLAIALVGGAAVLALNVTPEPPEQPAPVDSPSDRTPCHSGSGSCGGGG